MDFKRGMKKKGQEGVSTSTIVVFVLVGVFLIFAILFFTGAFGQISFFQNLAPSDLTKFAGACKTYSESQSLNGDYCLFREGTIAGVKAWYNCNFVFNAMGYVGSTPKADWTNIACGVREDVAKGECLALKNEKGDVAYQSQEVASCNSNGATVSNCLVQKCSVWGLPSTAA